MSLEEITSRQNPKVLDLIRLRDKKAVREASGLCFVEGYREVQRALQAGIEVHTLYFCKSKFRGPDYETLLKDALAKNAELIACNASVFEKISLRQGPDGMIATFRPPVGKLADLKLSQNPLILVAESLEKPGNLGALIRTLDGVGADALIVVDPVSDLYNPNIIRASQGACFSFPTLCSGREDAYNYLQSLGADLYAATPDASKTYWQADMKGGVAVLVGSEQAGLSPFWLEKANRIKIPMQGASDSLNVSTAGALILYEALRQRS